MVRKRNIGRPKGVNFSAVTKLSGVPIILGVFALYLAYLNKIISTLCYNDLMIRIPLMILFTIFLISSLVFVGTIRLQSEVRLDGATVISSSPSRTPSSTTSTVTLPPLYPGIKWKEPVFERNTVFSSNGDAVEVDLKLFWTEHFDSYPIEFTEYYNREFAERGWKLVEHASGPGPGDTEYFFWENGGHHATIGIFSDVSSSNNHSAYFAHDRGL